MARKKNTYTLKPVLFIACEGTSSEFQYFESWSTTIEVLRHFERVNVYPNNTDEKPKTTPYELFEKAREILRSESANSAWSVFDKDNHPKLPQTFNEADTDGVRIAFSSRSFEQWLLLHFEKSTRIYTATECKDADDKPINCGTPGNLNCNPVHCLMGHIRRQNYIPNLTKNKSFDLYTAVKDRTEIALVNSAWLRYHVGHSINVTRNPKIYPHIHDTYTDVDQLILFLNGRKDKIEWGSLNQDVSILNWVINATIVNGNIHLIISHNLDIPVPMNLIFSNDSFWTTDDNLNDISCVVVSKQLIHNANGSNNNLLRAGDRMEFVLTKNNQPYFLFKRIDLNSRIFIEL